MPNITCFLIEPIDQCEVELRRFVWSSQTKCSGKFGYHNAFVVIETISIPVDDCPVSTMGNTGETGWPTHCSCGYEFTTDDVYQKNYERLYRSPAGDLTTLRRAPVGAMWFADWMNRHEKPQPGQWTGPDGRCLAVMTPGGEWIIDGPSRDGGRWNRSGVPPLVTANPSIVCGSYHGFLRNGVLEDA